MQFSFIYKLSGEEYVVKNFYFCALLSQGSAGLCFASTQTKTSLQSGMTPFLSFSLPAAVLNSGSSQLFLIFQTHFAVEQDCNLALVTDGKPCFEQGYGLGFIHLHQ